MLFRSLLDRALAHYGPETQAGRDQLRRAVAFRLAVTWPEDASTPARLDTPETTPRVETIEAGIRELSPKTDGQRRSEEHTSELQSHSDLPSFPTRCSSDLCSTVRSPTTDRRRRQAATSSGAPSPSGSRSPGPRMLPRPRDWTLPRRRPGSKRSRPVYANSHRRPTVSVDRKSTRLNSSHTVIYPLSLHDALPISARPCARPLRTGDAGRPRPAPARRRLPARGHLARGCFHARATGHSRDDAQGRNDRGRYTRTLTEDRRSA